MSASVLSKRKYYEIKINCNEVPAFKRVVHVVTWREESPVQRALAEGLIAREQASKASYKELSVHDCLHAWEQTKRRSSLLQKLATSTATH